ncbi:metal-dependent hydrolase [Candidatus Micrarchaeota archaeon]|nr:metal-dependent hydrolase [Candidatus Micrarchaeota archaeon]
MNGPEHMFIGFLIFFLAGVFLFNFSMTDPYFILLVLFSGFSALVPDIDHHKATMRKWSDKAVPIFSFVFFFVQTNHFILAMGYAAIIFLAYLFYFEYLGPKHRGITHTLIFNAGYTALLFFTFGFMFAVSGGLGYLSHLLADKHIKLI